MQAELLGYGDAEWVEQQIVLNGHFTASILDYLNQRAARLSLCISLNLSPRQISLVASGPKALVGALEMAACIAPDDCFVEDWYVKDVIPNQNPN